MIYTTLRDWTASWGPFLSKEAPSLQNSSIFRVDAAMETEFSIELRKLETRFPQIKAWYWLNQTPGMTDMELPLLFSVRADRMDVELTPAPGPIPS